MTIDYDQQLYCNYHQGRRLEPSVMQQWRRIACRSVGDRSGLTILDLGCGTGRFSSELADELDGRVFGVEPSDKMRSIAESECDDSRVSFLKGSAESIPLTDDSCDVAWLSQVMHHFQNINAAARELKRIIRPAGFVIIRSNFKGRLADSSRYYDFFPTGLEVDESRHPTIEHVRDCFEENGFRLTTLETVEQIEATNLQEYTERIRLRTYSTFELISEEEFEQGLAKLQHAADIEKTPKPVTAKLDLLVFEHSGGPDVSA